MKDKKARVVLIVFFLMLLSLFAAACDEVNIEDALNGTPTPAASPPEGSPTPDASVPDGTSTPEAATPDGTVAPGLGTPDDGASTPEAATPESTVAPDSGTPEGTPSPELETPTPSFPSPVPLGNVTFVPLAARDGSAMAGAAVLVPLGDRTLVIVGLQSATVTEGEANVYRGSCEEMGNVEYRLAVVQDNTSLTVINAPIADLEEGAFAVSVNERGDDPATSIVCGNIPERPSSDS